jgi:hypothetical protein
MALPLVISVKGILKKMWKVPLKRAEADESYTKASEAEMRMKQRKVRETERSDVDQ